MNEEHPQFNTDDQRRALDVMSAKLLDNLNTMIAEQEARVQEFSLQVPAASSPKPEQWQHADKPAQDARPATEPVITYSSGSHKGVIPHPTKSSVTPPPVKPQKKVPQQSYRIPRPSQNPPISPSKKDEKENSVGCGKIAVICTIIIILLRACS